LEKHWLGALSFECVLYIRLHKVKHLYKKYKFRRYNVFLPCNCSVIVNETLGQFWTHFGKIDAGNLWSCNSCVEKQCQCLILALASWRCGHGRAEVPGSKPATV
jgi:hypothetical protein